MKMKIQYDVSIVDDKHKQIALMMGPLWRSKAMFCRFADGVADQPDDGGDVKDSGGDLKEGGTLLEGELGKGDLLNVASIVKPDGTFVNEWYNSELLPEDIRGNESLKVIKSLSDLSKRTIHAEKLVGKDKIPLPKANSTPEELQAFWDAVGNQHPDMVRPKTPDEYVAEVPEGMEAIFSEDRLKEVKEFAHSIGITKAQFSAYLKNEAETTKKLMEAEQAEAQRRNDENVLALKKEWGEAYPERQHVVKRLIAEAFGANEEAKMNFLQKYAGDPDFVRFAANVGVKLVESKAVVAELTQKTPSESLSKIKELEATPGYMDLGSSMTNEQRLEITQRIREHYQMAFPERR